MSKIALNGDSFFNDFKLITVKKIVPNCNFSLYDGLKNSLPDHRVELSIPTWINEIECILQVTLVTHIKFNYPEWFLNCALYINQDVCGLSGHMGFGLIMLPTQYREVA